MEKEKLKLRYNDKGLLEAFLEGAWVAITGATVNKLLDVKFSGLTWVK